MVTSTERADWSWFDLHWSWIGLGLAVLGIAVLLGGNFARSDGRKGSSRWRDPLWLAWFAPFAYMVHQFEEYGISAQGVRFAFPDLLCSSMSMAPYPSCALPHGLYVAINIPIIWGAGLVCGLLARKHPFVGLGVYSIHFSNALSHLSVWAFSGYNPGALTALLVQLPISLWVFYACFGQGAMRRRGIVVIALAGAVASAILIGAIKAFATGLIPAWALLTIQVLNPLTILAVMWPFERSVLRFGERGEA